LEFDQNWNIQSRLLNTKYKNTKTQNFLDEVWFLSQKCWPQFKILQNLPFMKVILFDKKFLFLTILSTKSFYFSQRSILTKNFDFRQQLRFWQKFRFSTHIYFDFRQNLRFYKNFDFLQQLRFLTKNRSYHF